MSAPYKLVDRPKPDPRLTALLAPNKTKNPHLQKKMAREIARSVLAGDVEAEEAGAYLLARAIRKTL